MFELRYNKILIRTSALSSLTITRNGVLIRQAEGRKKKKKRGRERKRKKSNSIKKHGPAGLRSLPGITFAEIPVSKALQAFQTETWTILPRVIMPCLFFFHYVRRRFCYSVLASVLLPFLFYFCLLLLFILFFCGAQWAAAAQFTLASVPHVFFCRGDREYKSSVFSQARYKCQKLKQQQQKRN